uniref:Uncharacterized protein n=1 Tax=Kalanchoe fedtschenkoi TaxID=63787 RepID=A0A7N1A318_KALFE
MDSLASAPPSLVLPRSAAHRQRRRTADMTSRSLQRRQLSSSLGRIRDLSWSPRLGLLRVRCRVDSGKAEEEESGDDEVERALRLDGGIPVTSGEFVKRVSSRAYDMRRNLQQTFDSSSYDVLEANPWREASKSVYVLTRRENQLCTMKTRSNRSEVERELGMLFSKREKQRRMNDKFQMLVEDVRDGILVFEDENEASKYCDLLQGKGRGCEGVAEIEASSVFDLCRSMRALAVLFRRGTTPPLPESLELNLRARKRSLEDQEEST